MSEQDSNSDKGAGATAITEELIGELIAEALDARQRAYAPYSNYQVGCALMAGGERFAAGNVENATYGLCVCAERCATLAAIQASHRQVDIVVVATQSSPPASPCGLCRQTLAEFPSAQGTTRVILVNPQGERSDHTLAELLPHSFSGDQLA